MLDHRVAFFIMYFPETRLLHCHPASPLQERVATGYTKASMCVFVLMVIARRNVGRVRPLQERMRATCKQLSTLEERLELLPAKSPVYPNSGDQKAQGLDRSPQSASKGAEIPSSCSKSGQWSVHAFKRA